MNLSPVFTAFFPLRQLLTACVPLAGARRDLQTKTPYGVVPVATTFTNVFLYFARIFFGGYFIINICVLNAISVFFDLKNKLESDNTVLLHLRNFSLLMNHLLWHFTLITNNCFSEELRYTLLLLHKGISYSTQSCLIWTRYCRQEGRKYFEVNKEVTTKNHEVS